MCPTVYLALGSNLGGRHALIAAAIDGLVAAGAVGADLARSRLYETDAVAETPQPPYLNAVVRATTSLAAPDLLARCLEVEAALGRVRPPGATKAPRTIDIDLLLYGGEVLHTPSLTVPHPAMLDRPFVLIPLADVAAPGLVHPVTGTALDRAPPSPGVRVSPEEKQGETEKQRSS